MVKLNLFLGLIYQCRFSTFDVDSGKITEVLRMMSQMQYFAASCVTESARNVYLLYTKVFNQNEAQLSVAECLLNASSSGTATAKQASGFYSVLILIKYKSLFRLL